MNETTPAGPESKTSDRCLCRNLIFPFGLAAIASLLAALSYFYPSSFLAGILFLVVAASSFGMAVQLVREKNARYGLINSQRQLAKDAARLQTFLHNARDGIHILDINGRIVDVSDSFCRMLGYTREDVIGMHVTQWDANFSAGKLGEFIPELFARAETSTFETRHRRKDGSIIDVEISGCPVEMNGQLVLFHSSRDITDRKALEERYRDIYATLLSAQKSE